MGGFFYEFTMRRRWVFIIVKGVLEKGEDVNGFTMRGGRPLSKSAGLCCLAWSRGSCLVLLLASLGVGSWRHFLQS